MSYEKKKPKASFPEGRGAKWVIWDNSPRLPTVQLQAFFKDKETGEWKTKTSLYLEELEKLTTAAPEAIEYMRNLKNEIERLSAITQGEAFSLPSSVDDDIDF